MNVERAVGSQCHAAERELLCKIKTGTEQTVPVPARGLGGQKRGYSTPQSFFYFFFSVLLVLLELMGRSVVGLGQMEARCGADGKKGTSCSVRPAADIGKHAGSLRKEADHLAPETRSIY